MSHHHPAAVNPQRNWHSKIHKVCASVHWNNLQLLSLNVFSLHHSVLGTLAATYLCVAVIVKYYQMDNHMANLTPLHPQGSVTMVFVFHKTCHHGTINMLHFFSFNSLYIVLLLPVCAPRPHGDKIIRTYRSKVMEKWVSSDRGEDL